MEKSPTTSDSLLIPFSVSALKPLQLRTCSSDRKRFMVLQAYGKSLNQSLKGTDVYPIIPSGSAFWTTPSFILTLMDEPQSKQGASICTVLPEKSQPTASDSNPHWANHFCWPSIVMRYWVGRLLNGGNEPM
jgi:hypothetical protein